MIYFIKQKPVKLKVLVIGHFYNRTKIIKPISNLSQNNLFENCHKLYEYFLMVLML